MRPPRANAYRDAWAASSTPPRAARRVRVAGWVHRRRDHGGLIFIDLRDRSGLVQLVFHPETAADAHALAERAALRARGLAPPARSSRARRATSTRTSPTGEIELDVASRRARSPSPTTPPFPVDEDGPVDETLRLRHRVLDLRREGMRDAMLAAPHDRARDARLPQRARLPRDRDADPHALDARGRARLPRARAGMSPGDFYALPQSPQLFKQLLMMAGFERYYQIARCFRDEDLRADRQPEFTQLDLEMSFVEEDDVIGVDRGRDGARVRGRRLRGPAPPPWPRLTYDEAMLRYGSDRPDLRFGLEIADLGAELAGTEFQVFAGVLASGGVVRGLNAGAREVPRSELDALTEHAKRYGAGGLVWAFVQEDGTWRSPIGEVPHRGAARRAVTRKLAGRPGDLLLIVADKPSGRRDRRSASCGWSSRAASTSCPTGRHDVALGRRLPDVRVQRDRAALGRAAPPVHRADRRLRRPGRAALARLRPRARRRRDRRRLDPYPPPRGPAAGLRRARHLARRRREARFGFLLDALRYGAPPHGGIALGLDRIVAILAGRDSIRDVIAFPKTASGADPLTGAPAPVDGAQLARAGRQGRRRRRGRLIGSSPQPAQSRLRPERDAADNGRGMSRSPRPSGSSSSARWPSWPPGCCSCGPRTTPAAGGRDAGPTATNRRSRPAARRPAVGGRQGRRGGQRHGRRAGRARRGAGRRRRRDRDRPPRRAGDRRRSRPRRAPTPGQADEAGRRGRRAAAPGRCARLGERRSSCCCSGRPKAADDKAVRKALARRRPPRRQGPGARAHIKQIAAYGQITRGADVAQSPTVVVVDRNRKVETLVGYVDRAVDRPGRHRRAAQLVASAYTRRVDAEAFAEHLQYPRGRGHAPPESFSGSAGGAACGDLIRVDLRVEGDRVADAGFEASGCGAAVAAGSAAVDAGARRGAARRRADRRGRDRRRARRAVAGQAARGRAGRRRAARRARRRGRAARSRRRALAATRRPAVAAARSSR